LKAPYLLSVALPNASVTRLRQVSHLWMEVSRFYKKCCTLEWKCYTLEWKC